MTERLQEPQASFALMLMPEQVLPELRKLPVRLAWLLLLPEPRVFPVRRA